MIIFSFFVCIFFTWFNYHLLNFFKYWAISCLFCSNTFISDIHRLCKMIKSVKLFDKRAYSITHTGYWRYITDQYFVFLLTLTAFLAIWFCVDVLWWYNRGCFLKPVLLNLAYLPLTKIDNLYRNIVIIFGDLYLNLRFQSIYRFRLIKNCTLIGNAKYF